MDEKIVDSPATFAQFLASLSLDYDPIWMLEHPRDAYAEYLREREESLLRRGRLSCTVELPTARLDRRARWEWEAVMKEIRAWEEVLDRTAAVRKQCALLEAQDREAAMKAARKSNR